MSPSALFFIPLALIPFFVIILQRHSAAQVSPKPSPAISSRNKIEKCISLIAAKVGPDGQLNQLSQLESRAIPNQRLVTGFGIENAFTTTDKKLAKEFVRRAVKYLAAVEWAELATAAHEEIQSFLDASAQNEVPLAKLVQLVSLSIALRVFVGEDTVTTDHSQSALLTIAESINVIWMDSKRLSDKIGYKERHELHDALRAVRHGLDPLNPRQNPLNWLLPSFETLWRIALRTFIEVKFSAGRAHPEWSRAVIAFARNPTTEQFERSFESQSVHEGRTKISVKKITDEALRLYLPTRHVHRVFTYDEGGGSGRRSWITTIAAAVSRIKAIFGRVGRARSDAPQPMMADIESLHIDEGIWGVNALKFVPERWNEISDLQEKAFMPFGNKPFVCPAKPVFGPRVIALVVGALLAVFEDDDWGLDYDNPQIEEELSVGARLSLERNQYTNIVLRRRS